MPEAQAVIGKTSGLASDPTPPGWSEILVETDNRTMTGYIASDVPNGQSVAGALVCLDR